MLVMASKFQLELLVTAFLLGYVHSQTTDVPPVVEYESVFTTDVPLSTSSSPATEVQDGTTRRQTYIISLSTEALERIETAETPTSSSIREAEDETSQTEPSHIHTTTTSGVVTTEAPETDSEGSTSVPPVTANTVSTDTKSLLRTTVVPVEPEQNITSAGLYSENITESTERTLQRENLTAATTNIENTTYPTEISFSPTQPYVKNYTLDTLESSSPPYYTETETTVSPLHESTRFPPAPSTVQTTELTSLLEMPTQTITTSQEIRTEGLSTSDVHETEFPVTREHTIIPVISVTTEKGTTPSEEDECSSNIECVKNAECKTVNGLHVCVCKTGFGDDTGTGECMVRTTPFATTSDIVFSSTVHSTEETTAVSYNTALTEGETEDSLDVSLESSTKRQSATITDRTRTPTPFPETAEKTTQTTRTTFVPDGARTTSFSPSMFSTTKEGDIVWEYMKPVEQLSVRESAGSVSVVFLAGISALQWVTDIDVLFRKALADIINNRTQEVSSAATTTSVERTTYLLVYPRDVVYIEPFPHYKNTEVVVSFFVKKRTIMGQEEVWPRHVIIAALRGKKHWIEEQIRWNITAVFGGVPSYEVQHMTPGFFYPHLDLLIVVILVMLAILCLVSLALVCSWCRSTQRARWDPPAGYTHYDRVRNMQFLQEFQTRQGF